MNGNERVVCVVQARCTSERLPGKVMLPLAERPIVEHVLNAALAAQRVDEVVLATTTNVADDELASHGRRLGVRVFRGSENDVLGRFVGAVQGLEADVVVRNTADDPLLDPTVIDMVVADFLAGGCDYSSNILERSWPRGMDTEVFSRGTLDRAEREGLRAEDREHVTIFVRTHPERFRLRNVAAPTSETWPDLRLCIDTVADYEMLRAIFEELATDGQAPPVREVVAWLRNRPDVVAINASVQQRTVLGRQF